MALALLGAAGTALADAQNTVVVVGAAQSCSNATAERALGLAEQASRDGNYQRAAECYLAAGQQSLADQAFVKASAQSTGDTSRRLAANLSDWKASARQMKQALQHR